MENLLASFFFCFMALTLYISYSNLYLLLFGRVGVDLAWVSGIVATLCSVGVALFTILYMTRKLNRYDDLVESVSDLLRYETDEETGQVLLDARLTGMIGALSSGIAKSIKMSLLQGLSVDAKLEKGLKGAIAQDVVENKMPILNLVGDVLGFNTKAWIAKHPEALAQLAPMLGKFMGGIQGIGGNPPNNSGGSAGYG